MKKAKVVADGWHNAFGVRILIEDGKVIAGVWNNRPLCPYRKNRRDGGWDNVSGEITLAAYRAGWYRDTIRMM